MDGARWREVERVVDVALDSEPGEWPAILDEQCGTDLELRREVEALLSRYTSAQRYLDSPPVRAASAVISAKVAEPFFGSDNPTGVAVGDRYEIQREIGRGGMATVYLARDQRHARDVALKVLTRELATGVRRDRFLREIGIAARLTHPHILPLHDSGDADGLLYYVMPYVNGETLRARLAREGPFDPREAIVILRDVVDALAYAHDHGVVHRDVKPENIMLSGRHALVADFGVAKALHVAANEPQVGSGAGLWLGTPAYMAPEQAVADPHIDHRADLYSLGVVAYEMLTGRLPFTGRTPQELLVAHMTAEAEPLEKQRPDVPPELAQVVMTCLAKKPGRRWQSAEELIRRLDTCLTSGSGAVASAPPLPRAKQRGVLVAAMVTFVVIAMGVWSIRASAPSSEVAPLPTSRQITFTGDVRHASISPDGRYLAVTRGPPTQPRPFLFELRGTGGTEVPVGNGIAANEVAWTADGSAIILRVVDSTGRYAGYRAAPLVGGSLRAVVGREYHNRLSPDGTRVAGWTMSSKGVSLRDVRTGDSTTVPVPGEYSWFRHVAWSPDSRWLLVQVQEGDRSSNRLVIVDAAGGGTPRDLLRDSVSILTPVWHAAGTIYFLRQRAGAFDLWRIQVSPSTGAPTGKAVLAAPGLEVAIAHPGDGALFDAVSLSADARLLAYVRDRTRANLVAFDADPSERRYRRAHDLTVGTSTKGAPVVSPNREWIAYTDGDRSRRDVYVIPYAGGSPRRLTSLGTVRYAVAWSPQSDRIAFVSREGERNTVWWVSIDGRTQRQYRETVSGTEPHGLTWSPAANILYQRLANRNWHWLDVTTGRERPLLRAGEEGWFFDAMVSPDGGTVAVRWNRRERGVWLIESTTGMPRFLIGGEYDYHLGWEPDGQALRVLSARSGRVIRVATDGRVLGGAPSLPDDCHEQPTTIDFRRIICTSVITERDAWTIESFDRAATGQRD